MKPTELRIGNLISFEGYANKVTALPVGSTHSEWQIEIEYHDYSFDDIQPLPLSEEWLDRHKLPEWIQVEIYRSDINGNYFMVQIGRKHPDGGYIWMPLPKEYKYVHQLQNLYFALTGKELENSGKENQT